VTAAAGRTGTVERTAACEAGRHHLCRGTIVSLTAAHGAPAAAPATAATCGDLSLVGLGQPGHPMRVNVLARDESIAFRCPPRQEPVINLTSRMCRRSPTDR
jgi:hypothetical protein